MGSLNSLHFLVNNPHVKIDSLIAGSPFWGFGEKVSQFQRIMIKALGTVLEEMPINGSGSSHFLSHDKNFFIHEMVVQKKSTNTYMSGGILNSMYESIEDITENAKLFNKPLLVFIAG